MVEVVGGEIRELEDVRVAKEGLVAAEKRGMRHRESGEESVDNKEPGAG